MPEILQPTLWVIDINPSGTVVFQKVLEIPCLLVKGTQLWGAPKTEDWPRNSIGMDLPPLEKGKGKTQIYASTETTTSQWWFIYQHETLGVQQIHLTQDYAIEYTSKGVFLVCNTKDRSRANRAGARLREIGLQSDGRGGFIVPDQARLEFRESVE